MSVFGNVQAYKDSKPLRLSQHRDSLDTKSYLLVQYFTGKGFRYWTRLSGFPLSHSTSSKGLESYHLR